MMALKDFTDGDALPESDLDTMSNEHLTLIGLNTIRQLIARAGIWSKGLIDGYGDAYIDSNGRENSVNTGTSTATFDTTKYKPDTTAKTVIHAIPTGTFSSTISTAVGVPMIEDWETGDDIQYKLTNAGEDSGWLSCGNTPGVSSFTAFTSEPTTLTVNLIPKVSAPTTGYPSVKGFFIRST